MIDMELSDIRPLIEFYHSKLSQVSLDFKLSQTYNSTR